MSRNNVVQVEFRVTGSGLRDFGVLGQAALNLQNSIGATAGRFAELERASAAASGALANNAQTFEELARSLRLVDTASRQAGASLEGLRGVTEIARNFGPLGAAAGAAADRIGTLVQGAASAGSAIPIVGLAVAAAALQFYAFAKAAEFAVGSVFSLAEATIPKAEALKAALAGLTSVARFKGITAEEATSTVQNLELVKSGLLSVADASTALKNLLAAGFGLKESAVIVERFGDAAAFGKQSALSFGQAVVSGTEGIKNQNSILVDNVGITKNLSVILKEAGFQMEDLSNATKGAAARQALYNGLLKESQGQVGDAARLAASYSGQLAKIDATFTAIEASIGQFFTSNKALNDVLEFVDRSLQLVAKDSAAWGTALAGLLPFVQVGVSLVSVLVGGLASISAALALAIKGIGSADEALGALTGNTELERKGRNLRIAGDDLLKISTDAALVAAKLPGDVGRINESLAKVGQPTGAQSQGISVPDLFNKGLDALIAGARERFAAKQAMQRTELEADIKVNEQARKIQEQYLQILKSGGTQAQALLDQRAAFARKLIAATPGAGPGDDLSARLGEIDQQAATRLAAETERIAKLKRDAARLADPFARGALSDNLDAKLADFKAVNALVTQIEEGFAKLDAAKKVGDQALEINKAITDAKVALDGDNPYVKLFTDAETAIQAFKTKFEGQKDAIQEFTDATRALEAKQTAQLDVSNFLKVADLEEQLRNFRQQAGLDSADTADEINRRIIDRAQQLRLIGDELSAAKFLTGEVAAGRLDVSILNGGQVDEIQRAFETQKDSIEGQKSTAERLTETTVSATNTLVDALKLNNDVLTTQVGNLIKQLNSLEKEIKAKSLIARVDVVAGPQTTVDAVPSGSLP